MFTQFLYALFLGRETLLGDNDLIQLFQIIDIKLDLFWDGFGMNVKKKKNVVNSPIKKKGIKEKITPV